MSERKGQSGPGGRAPVEPLYEPRFLHPGLMLAPIVLSTPLVAVAAALGGTRMPTVWVLALIGCVVVLVLGITAWWLLRLRRVASLIRRHGRFLCLNCHYPLTGLPDAGACPECNHPYERAVNERRWRSWEESVNKGRPLA